MRKERGTVRGRERDQHAEAGPKASWRRQSYGEVRERGEWEQRAE